MAKPAAIAPEPAVAAPARRALVNTAWSGDRLLVGTIEDADRVRRKLLSASVAHGVLECEARAVASRLLPRVDDPFGARELGTSQHTASELLYELPPEERTREAALEIVDRLADEQWNPRLLPRQTKAALSANDEQRGRWVEIVRRGVMGIFILEDPTTIDVYARELEVKGRRIAAGPGLEAGIPVVGYIDRIDRDANGDLVIRDYKFGKFKKPYRASEDQYGDQLRIYRDMVEAELGIAPVGGKLLYPAAVDEHGTKAQRAISFAPADLATTRAMFRNAYVRLNAAADARSFLAMPSNLCGWCELVNSCPVAKVVTDKAKANAETMPSAVELGIPTLRPGASPADAMWGSEPGPEAQPPRMQHSRRNHPAANTATTNGTERAMNQAPEPLERSMGVRPEGPAFDETVNGELNINSYAAIAASGVVNDAFQMLAAAKIPISLEAWTAMTRTISGILLRAQLDVSGQANYQRGAQTRLRGLFKTFVEAKPFPFGQSADVIEKWVAMAERMLKQGVALIDAVWAEGSDAIDTTPYFAFAAEGGADEPQS